MPRQLIRLKDVRAPSQPNDDQLTQGQIRQVATDAVTMDDYNSAVISQIRIVSGSNGWTEPPAPGNGGGGGQGQEILGEVPSGVTDGQNVTFILAKYAIPATVKVYYNSLRLCSAGNADYSVTETTLGAGFNVVTLTGALPPRSRDRLWVDYTPA